ncbi:kelch-like protein 12 [Adelges cooleyi]|uniref:kelch-like protein 12 n=1 Tax=Adelges cooleyi TaxID=133065 RepID=UPI00217F380F|nr:kelch-like protein 12 [Adelges cooleyi]
MSILTAADYLDMDSIIKLCCTFIEQNIDAKNCVPFMLGAKAIFQTNITQLCYLYLEQHFSDLLELTVDNLYDLGHDDLTRLISSEYLGIPEEIQVFKFVMDWVKHDKENRKIFLPSLLEHVRWLVMSQEDFDVVCEEPLLTNHRDYLNALLKNIFKKNKSLPKETKNPLVMSSSETRRFPHDLGVPNVIFVIPRGLGKIGNKLLEYLDISSDTDTAGMEWKKMPMFFSFNRRSSKLVVSPRGVMFEIGGYSKTRAILNNVDALDLTKVNRKWIPKSPLGLARLFFAVCMSEDKIFVVGGFAQYTTGGLIGATTNMCEVYDIATDTWKVTTSMRVPRKNCSAVYNNGFVYVVGGSSDDSDIIERYDVANDTWMEFNRMTLQRSHTSVIIMNSKLYIIGGSDVNNSMALCNTVECCSLETEDWCSVAQMNKPRALANAIVIKNKLYVIGGDYDNATTYTAETYDPVLNKWDLITAPRNMLDDHRNEPDVVPFSKMFLRFANIDLK